jgi:phosphoglycolate phosphatase-like HAD superfamily hydrolase
MDENESVKLLLFDIDGTLIRSAGAGRDSMEKSFKKIYGIDDGFQNIHMMGRTDPSILKEALGNHDLEWREDEVTRFRDTYFQILEKEIEIPKEGKRICKGISELLAELQDRQGFVLGLLTGNWRTSGFIKLRHFGLDGYFSIGVFGDDSDQRDELVPIMMERFEKRRGFRPATKNVFVIGDTPMDVQCAKPHGVRTVAVATGFHTVDQLAPERPDYVFEDFGDTEKVVKIFN